MSYLTQSQANRPVAIAGVIAVHAELAAVVLAGFAVADVIRKERTVIDVYDVKDPPPPEPQPEPKIEPEPAVQQLPVPAPEPVIDLVYHSQIDRLVDDFSPIIDVDPIILPPVDTSTGKFQTVEPDRATPRNNPGHWVTDNDYKSRWIREERYGTASFRLEIAANGRVNDCVITRSTGHTVLDKATCDLIAKRARFNPATDASGAAISSSYSSSIRWVLPD